MQAIPNLKISAPNHLSDHAHISCTLKTGHQTLRPSTVYHNHNNLTTKMLKKYKWDANSANNFQNALELPTICVTFGVFVVPPPPPFIEWGRFGFLGH